MTDPAAEDFSSRRDMWILLAIPLGSAGLAILVEELLRAVQVREFLPSTQPQALGAVVGFVPAWMITAACFRQKHTYNAGIYEKNPGRLIPAWIVFLSAILIMTACVLGVPTWWAFEATIKAGRGAGWLYGAGVLAAGLGSVVVSVSAVSRGLWIWDMQRHVDQLATSTVRSLAHGLVELRGKARRVTPGPDQAPIFGQTANNVLPVGPFLLEDATGAVLVRPPSMDATGDPRIALRHHPVEGLPVLMPGDDVIVIGALSVDSGRPDPAEIRAWMPSQRPFGTRVLSRPDVFLIACGDEQKAKARLFRSRIGWLLLGSTLTLGSLVVAAVGAASLAAPKLISSFRSFAP